MADVVHGPDFQKATTVVLSDAADNATGSCGLHNANAAGTAGLVSVLFEGDDPGEQVTLRVNAGDFVFCALRRVRSTGTTIAQADLRILY